MFVVFPGIVCKSRVCPGNGSVPVVSQPVCESPRGKFVAYLDLIDIAYRVVELHGTTFFHVGPLRAGAAIQSSKRASWSWCKSIAYVRCVWGRVGILRSATNVLLRVRTWWIVETTKKQAWSCGYGVAERRLWAFYAVLGLSLLPVGRAVIKEWSS